MAASIEIAPPELLRRRIAAGLADAAIAAILGGAAGELTALGLAALGAGEDLREAMRRLLLVASHAGFSVAMTAGPRQATWGQRCFALKLIGPSGGRVSLAEAFGRWLAFAAAVLPLGAGLLLALGPERRPLQDRLCDTRLIAAVEPRRCKAA